ncbi:MAG: ATP-dependent RecD-like DNA helicase [Verrucomicrobiaceae bacterium]|nr:ATP-dependent RecD-like DNA helicase [Verrucomicrobiaceae bacterium]
MMPPPSRRPTSKLRGIVERVVFHTEDTGYCVLRVQPEGAREVVTVLGTAPRVVAGEQCEAEGQWTQNAEYGRQFKADALKLSRPDSLEGIERYLASGLIEGIGAKYAKRLVEKFGKDVFEMIENYSARLEEVEGVGRKRRKEIRESWMKQKTVHNIMLFLHQHGISTSRAQRIFKTYGEESLEVLRANPYRLAADIAGIGFKTADDIARKVGVARDSPERIRAGIIYALESAAGNGHCCLPEPMLLKQAAELLAADAAQVELQVAHLVFAQELVRHEIEGEPFLYLPHLRSAEKSVADKLRSLVARPPAYPVIDADKAITWAAKKTGKPLAESQQHAVREALQNRVLIITGGPGVGKTTILNTILHILEAKDVKIVLAAPTGRAAKRMNESTHMEAKTIHRLLEYQGEGQWGRHRGRPLEGDLFVLDESSMIDVRLMAQFLAALPFDAHLLVVGDADQLPSVGPGMVLADLIASGRVLCVKLTEIFRQAANSRIVTSAHEVNRGQIPDLKPHAKSDFFFIECTEPEEIRETIIGLVRDRLPAKYRFDPVQHIQVLTPMNRHLLGTQSLNQALQSALNPPNELKFEIERFGTTFRVGDKVIQTHNNYDKEVFNGDIGYIVAIETDPMKLQVRYDTRVVDYEPGELDELQLAYALTIHKSQGSEFPCVIIPLTTQHYVLLERSLLYTAITRAKRLVVLVGDERALSLAVRKQENRRRFTGLRAELMTPV